MGNGFVVNDFRYFYGRTPIGLNQVDGTPFNSVEPRVLRNHGVLIFVLFDFKHLIPEDVGSVR